MNFVNQSIMVVHGIRGLVEFATLSAIEFVVHGCDVLNKRGFARPYVLSEHTLVIKESREYIPHTYLVPSQVDPVGVIFFYT